MKSNKEFKRNVCFSFFEDYRLTAKELEKDFDKSVVADYYNAIIDYALYGIEPELQGALKYVWHTTKTTIDKSIERREKGFRRENIEQTEAILKYKTENPDATQREIGLATRTSVGKVNKVLKECSSSSFTGSNTNSNTTSITSSEREHEHHSCSASHKEMASPKKVDFFDAPAAQPVKGKTYADFSWNDKGEIYSLHALKNLSYEEIANRVGTTSEIVRTLYDEYESELPFA